MKTVKEVSKLTGISIRTLQYYDKIGLLKPSARTDAGYRLYNDGDLATLRQILFFRELEFPLKEIKEIITAENFDREKALLQQIELLTLKKEHIEGLINHACQLQQNGGIPMDFSAFDKSKINRYTEEAKSRWGDTAAYAEYTEKAQNRTEQAEADLAAGLMALFTEFGALKELAPDSEQAQKQVQKLQGYISEHYYRCTEEILAGLGEMYSAGGEFTANIDNAGGAGTAAFVTQAIRHYCK